MKKILYIINVDWFFISHFLPIELKKGYYVHIACGITDKKESICDNKKIQKYLGINQFIEFKQGIMKI